MENKILIGIGILIIVVLVGGCVSTPPIYPGEKEIPFETIEKGANSYYSEKGNLVINDDAAWNELWLKMNGCSPSDACDIFYIPDVDFTDSTLIAVFMGQKNTGGYSIDIAKIVKIEPRPCSPTQFCAINRSGIVYYKETSPKPGDIVTQALTQPYHIVKTEKITGLIEFQKIE